MQQNPRLIALAARHGRQPAAVVLLLVDLYATAEAAVGVVIDQTQLERLATLAARHKLCWTCSRPRPKPASQIAAAASRWQDSCG